MSFLPLKITVRYANGMSSTGRFFSVHLDIFLVSAKRLLLLNVPSLELVPVMNSVTKEVSKCRATFLFAALFSNISKLFATLLLPTTKETLSYKLFHQLSSWPALVVCSLCINFPHAVNADLLSWMLSAEKKEQVEKDFSYSDSQGKTHLE